jgi:hypothetical protein
MPDMKKTTIIEKPDGTVRTKTVEVNADAGRGITMSQTTDGQTAIQVQPQAVDVAQSLPDTMSILTLAVVVAVATWGILEAVKQLFSSWKKKHNGDTPWYWSASLRLAALGLGAGMGTFLYESLGGIGSGWPWGTFIGLGAGALCTIIVGVVKKLIRKKAA